MSTQREHLGTTPDGQGLLGTLFRVHILQMLFISVITALGVYVAALVVEKVMIRTALEKEAAHFWQARETDNTHPAPNTANLLGHLSALAQPGDDLFQGAAPGFQRWQHGDVDTLIHVSAEADQRLVLVFDEQSVRRLSFYFGVVPLSLALVVIYVSAWLAYRYSARFLSPVTSLASTMRHFNLYTQKFDDLRLDAYTQSNQTNEVRTLAGALKAFTSRLQQQIVREREFTRDISHEIRTPLAVVLGSLDVLESSSENPSKRTRAVSRIRTTCQDMLATMETLLLLAREDAELGAGNTVSQDWLNRLVEQVSSTHNQDSHVKIHVDVHEPFAVDAPRQALAIVIGNLLRNACNYTPAGEVTVAMMRDRVVVSDTGPGMSDDTLSRIQAPFARESDTPAGHGLGLDIVRRVCERFGWSLQWQSRPGSGTAISVILAGSEPA
ncbi:MAG: HAMP domain-containing sensor histidine kinase [Pseudomonadota bacterium]